MSLGVLELGTITESIEDQIRRHEISFERANAPNNPISQDADFNGIYYARTGLLCQNPNESLIFCNREASRIFGYLENELIGISSLVLVPKRLRASREDLLEKVLREDKVIHNHETARLRKDGEEVQITATIFRYEFTSGIYSIAATVILKQ